METARSSTSPIDQNWGTMNRDVLSAIFNFACQMNPMVLSIIPFVNKQWHDAMFLDKKLDGSEWRNKVFGPIQVSKLFGNKTFPTCKEIRRGFSFLPSNVSIIIKGGCLEPCGNLEPNRGIDELLVYIPKKFSKKNVGLKSLEKFKDLKLPCRSDCKCNEKKFSLLDKTVDKAHWILISKHLFHFAPENTTTLQLVAGIIRHYLKTREYPFGVFTMTCHELKAGAQKAIGLDGYTFTSTDKNKSIVNVQGMSISGISVGTFFEL